MSDPIELVVVEDDPRTLKNLVRLLSSYDDFRVVGSALSGEAGLQTIAALGPQFVLLDLELPDTDGIEVTKKIKAILPETEVLILTSFEDEVKVYKAIQAGASGYLVKRIAPEKIHESILEVLNGGVVIEPRLARRFWNYFKSVQGKSEAEDHTLEEIERDILQMIARGLTNQETGRVLSLARRTVRTHLSHVYRKLGTSSRAEAVVIALKKGLINL
ncbi:MAG: response regulator transcription factor [Deltaproteobacteria bacterium]|nr:response regulator transcription factor [Deltaproteobacteria bacterium]